MKVLKIASLGLLLVSGLKLYAPEAVEPIGELPGQEGNQGGGSGDGQENLEQREQEEQTPEQEALEQAKQLFGVDTSSTGDSTNPSGGNQGSGPGTQGGTVGVQGGGNTILSVIPTGEVFNKLPKAQQQAFNTVKSIIDQEQQRIATITELNTENIFIFKSSLFEYREKLNMLRNQVTREILDTVENEITKVTALMATIKPLCLTPEDFTSYLSTSAGKEAVQADPLQYVKKMNALVTQKNAGKLFYSLSDALGDKVLTDNQTKELNKAVDAISQNLAEGQDFIVYGDEILEQFTGLKQKINGPDWNADTDFGIYSFKLSIFFEKLTTFRQGRNSFIQLALNNTSLLTNVSTIITNATPTQKVQLLEKLPEYIQQIDRVAEQIDRVAGSTLPKSSQVISQVFDLLTQVVRASNLTGKGADQVQLSEKDQLTISTSLDRVSNLANQKNSSVTSALATLQTACGKTPTQKQTVAALQTLGVSKPAAIAMDAAVPQQKLSLWRRLVSWFAKFLKSNKTPTVADATNTQDLPDILTTAKTPTVADATNTQDLPDILTTAKTPTVADATNIQDLSDILTTVDKAILKKYPNDSMILLQRNKDALMSLPRTPQIIESIQNINTRIQVLKKLGASNPWS